MSETANDLVPHTHCHACGSRYVDAEGWPKTCQRCGTISWGNPIPVVAIVQPVSPILNDTPSLYGLLTIRRGIEPKIGHFALPGGYVDHGETVRIAAARELREETGIEHDPEAMAMIDVKSSTNGKTSITFLRAPLCTEESVIRAFRGKTPCTEVTGIGIMWTLQELAFPSHTEISRRWFNAALKEVR